MQTTPASWTATSTLQQHIGRKVKAKYNGEWIPGTVEGMYTNNKGQMRWSLRFEDGHVMQASEKQLKNLLVYVRRKQVGRQLDYVLVSKRWLSSVEDCKVLGWCRTLLVAPFQFCF